MINLDDLEDGPAIDFKSATLKIGKDSFSRNITTKTADSVNLIKLSSVSSWPDSTNVSDSTSGNGIGLSSCENDSTTLPVNNCTALTSSSQGADCSSLIPWWGENVEDFFSNRVGLIEQAIEDCKKQIISDEDGDFIGAWLLTEISSWDTEKERLILLSSMSVYTVKYDFIALKLLDHDKVPLSNIDTIIIGGLIYPNNSLIPRLNGLVSGVSGAVRGCVLQPLNERLATAAAQQSGSEHQILNKTNPLEHANFEPRCRNINGVRTMWNNGKELPFIKKWNPFTKTPWTTYTSHPLFWNKAAASIDEKRKKMYNVDDFTQNLVHVIEKKKDSSCSMTHCNVEHRSILLENYINLPSLIHNKNSLGFFKVRGKFSF